MELWSQVYEEAHLGLAHARSIRVSLEQHRNAGADRIVIDELLVSRGEVRQEQNETRGRCRTQTLVLYAQ